MTGMIAARAAPDCTSVYDEITPKIIGDLGQGRVLGSSFGAAARPRPVLACRTMPPPGGAIPGSTFRSTGER